MLFIMFMYEINKSCKTDINKLLIRYTKLQPVKMTACAFADDGTIMADTEENLQHNLNLWNKLSGNTKFQKPGYSQKII